MSTSARQPLLITDLVDRVVEGEVSPKTSHQHWRIVEYELEQIGSGRGLMLGTWRPGHVRIRLDVAGHYRISLVSVYAELRLKLSGDRCFKQCEPVREGHRRIGAHDVYREGYYDSEEVYWRDADLTGQDLIVSDCNEVSLLAIRLIPIDAPAPDTRQVAWPMFFTLDGGNMGEHVHESPDDMFESAERVPQDSCVRVMVYGGIGGDICYHHTNVGSEFGSVRDKGDEWDGHHKNVCANLEQWRQWGRNPAVAMVEYAHARNWELHFYQRMGWDGAAPNNGCCASRFFLDHPQYHTLGPKGEKVRGLSVAYPEVTDHLAAFYGELASFGADGVSPCFIRGCPMVLYEPIMVEGFRSKYGKDPRDLPSSDPDWQDYRAQIVTQFMRRMKDELGDCRLSPLIHGTQALNRRFALDIATWVREGIVDDLFIMGHQYDRHDGHFGGGPNNLDFEYFNALPGRQNVRLWPMFYPYAAFESYRDLGYDHNWDLFSEAFQRYLDQGANGYGLWDATPLYRESNIFDLGRLPRPHYKEPNRLVSKYERVSWDGYLWNRWTPVESS